MKRSLLILMVTFLVFSLTVSNAEEQSNLLRNGICFGDTVQDVKEKESFSLFKEDVDGVAAVWGADGVKLYGLGSSSINYLFNSDDELFEVYEYFQDKASIKTGKKDYQTVQKELEKELGSPLQKNEHVTLNTAGFDVDDYVATMKGRKAKVEISERDMWIVDDGNFVITIDHVGVSFSDLYKHYLFIVAEEKCKKTGTTEYVPIEYSSGDYKYILLEDGTAELIKHEECDNSEIAVPTMMDGHVVTSIRGQTYAECGSLTTVSIPDGVLNVNGNPFANQYREGTLKTIRVSESHPTLATIDGVLFDKKQKTLICYPRGYTNTEYTIPQGIRAIGDDAFYCADVKSVTIPDSVASIGEGAFYLCMSLENITIPDSVNSIKDEAFYFCNSLESITIPNNVTLIGEYAFAFCDSLKSITIPDKVTSIGEWAFNSCILLKNIAIPDSVTFIGANAFANCTSLESITIPDSVSIVGNPFQSCVKLQEVTLRPSDSPMLEVIDGVLFNKKQRSIIASLGVEKEAYVIPNNIASIGEKAFWDYTSLESIIIPDSVTSIGAWAFGRCRSLNNVIIPDSVTTIGDRAFWDCGSLESITIPDSVTWIGQDAFLGCHAISAIVESESYAEEYCKQNNIPYSYVQSSIDWLSE